MLRGTEESLGLMCRRTFWVRERAAGRSWDRGLDLVWAGPGPPRAAGPGSSGEHRNTEEAEQPWLWTQTWA